MPPDTSQAPVPPPSPPLASPPPASPGPAPAEAPPPSPGPQPVPPAPAPIAQPETPPSRPLRVAAVADLHVHKLHIGQYKRLFAEISERADILALCGDLTNLGLTEEAEHLAADLLACKIPVVAVLGNHDHHAGKPEEVKRILRTRSGVTFLDDETFAVDGVGFAGVKGFGGGFGNHMLSPFGEEMTKEFVRAAINEALALENAMTTLMTDRTVVVMHYSPIMDTIRGESPEVYPFLGCSRLAETIDRFPVVAAFHGHAHHGQPQGRTPKGVPVYNCSIEVMRRLGGLPYMIVEV